MTHTYNIAGMTCNNCVAKVKSELLKVGDITEVEVQLTAPQATLSMQKHIPVEDLQSAIFKAGNYTITELGNEMDHTGGEKDLSWFATYKPLIIIGAFIIGLTLLLEINRGSFNLEIWMQNFMAGFFLTFSFFKLLDIRGFADSYTTYDIIARKWRPWGYIYAFIELALGLAFLLRFNPLLTNTVTFVVMSISIVGVLQSILNKRKIRCACLGAVFNLPMSTITVIEDALMIIMSGIMIITHI
jgi:copper chaperone CopZ